MRLGSTSQDRAAWLGLFALLLGILAPAATVIWFMNEAVVNQADASRQRESDAYRGQLRLLRDRIEAEWQSRMAELSADARRGPAAFRRTVGAGNADAIVFFRSDGLPEYPTASALRGVDSLSNRSDWRTAETLEGAGEFSAAATAYAGIAGRERNVSLAARAAQAHVRSLAKDGQASAALRAIDTYFGAGRLISARDQHGRLIAADARLFALRLANSSKLPEAPAAERLETLLNDYERVSMPASQRLFLMSELLQLAPYQAERLAAEFLEADGTSAGSGALEPSSVRGVWKLRTRENVVALFRTETIAAAARRILDEQSAASGARFMMAPPGTRAGDEAIATSLLLPGWQIGVSLVDAERTRGASRRRVATYLWAGSIAIGVLAVAGMLLWQTFQRQLRLTRLKTDLVAAVSHELKTPLASMRLLVDSLLEEDDLDRKRTRDYLQLIAGENARLTRLIEHFLTFSRIERNRHRFVFGEVRPAAVARSAVGLVRERFEAADADLRVDVPGDLPSLRGDEDALVTVLLNVLENAYHYTRAETRKVTLQAYRDADTVVFEVTDNGIGIARRDQKRVFRRFYQVDQSLSRETGGCGLGLSIVDYIVRAHGGTVALSSQVGVGSTFRISLPCLRTAQGAMA
jgi:signal transduction histidine kinase